MVKQFWTLDREFHQIFSSFWRHNYSISWRNKDQRLLSDRAKDRFADQREICSLAICQGSTINEISTNIRIAPLPALPTDLEQLIDQPWDRETSLLIDRWLDHINREWEVKK